MDAPGVEGGAGHTWFGEGSQLSQDKQRVQYHPHFDGVTKKGPKQKDFILLAGIHKASTADLGVAFCQISSRSTCWFDQDPMP